MHGQTKIIFSTDLPTHSWTFIRRPHFISFHYPHNLQTAYFS